MLNKLKEGEEHRRKLHEYIQNIRGNIRVYCRVKPTKEESIIKYPEISSVNIGIGYESNDIHTIEIKNNKNNELTIFNFDRIFTERTSQEEVI